MNLASSKFKQSSHPFIKFSLITSILMCGSGTGFAFTIEELHKSAQTATETFKSEYGLNLHDSIYGVQTTKGRDSSRVKLFYRQNETAQTIEYFCHYHGVDVLDCHEH
jgi:hypothetical protein